MMKVRRHARSITLQCLYELDYTSHPLEDVLHYRLEDHAISAKGEAFVGVLLRGVYAQRDVLDQVISELAPEWPVNQISPIDRNILRLAVFELLHQPDTPIKVAINEAVELAKQYGSESSPRFINGVLGSLAAQRNHYLEQHSETV